MKAILSACGPYKVASHPNGTLTITPAWPQCVPWNPQEGGGPGVLMRMALAEAVESNLNRNVPAKAKRKAKR